MFSSPAAGEAAPVQHLPTHLTSTSCETDKTGNFNLQCQERRWGSRRICRQVGISCALQSPSRISMTIISSRRSAWVCHNHCPFCGAQPDSCVAEVRNFISRRVLQLKLFLFIFLLQDPFLLKYVLSTRRHYNILNYFSSCLKCMLFICSIKILSSPPPKHQS